MSGIVIVVLKMHLIYNICVDIKRKEYKSFCYVYCRAPARNTFLKKYKGKGDCHGVTEKYGTAGKEEDCAWTEK